MGYAENIEDLLSRIRKVAKKHPDEVLALTSPFGLFKLGMPDSDKDTLAQASACLRVVQRELRDLTSNGEGDSLQK